MPLTGSAGLLARFTVTIVPPLSEIRREDVNVAYALIPANQADLAIRGPVWQIDPGDWATRPDPPKSSRRIDSIRAEQSFVIQRSIDGGLSFWNIEPPLGNAPIPSYGKQAASTVASRWPWTAD